MGLSVKVFRPTTYKLFVILHAVSTTDRLVLLMKAEAKKCIEKCTPSAGSNKHKDMIFLPKRRIVTLTLQ